MNAIILSDIELDLKIKKKVQQEVQQFINEILKTKIITRKTNLDMTEGIEFLESIGYKCSISLISKLTMKDEIPFSKFGRRISFNTDDLTKWVENQKSKTVDITGNVSKSATSKFRR